MDVPAPICGKNDVLIDVRASSVNPVDCKIRQGNQRGALRYRLPWTLGLDVSGVVSEVGSAVTHFQVGDEVYGSPSHRRPGAYAEQIAVDAREVARKPTSLSHEEAASLPLVGQTAWACLMPWLTQQTEPTVFIQAGAGGVGSFAIQLARHHGARVVTTCSSGNAQLVSDPGAHQVIDYTKQDYAEVLNDVDFTLDAIGYEHRDRALQVTRKGGVVASIVGGMPKYTQAYGPNLAVLAVGAGMLRFMALGLWHGVKARNVIRSPDARILDQITALVDAGSLRPLIDTVYPLEEAAKAHAHVETGRTRGKVVIAVS